MTAKEMFEELGYKVEDEKYVVIIKKNMNDWSVPELWEDIIFFVKLHKVVEFVDKITINAKTVKAINKQIEELGWLDD